MNTDLEAMIMISKKDLISLEENFQEALLVRESHFKQNSFSLFKKDQIFHLDAPVSILFILRGILNELLYGMVSNSESLKNLDKVKALEILDFLHEDVLEPIQKKTVSYATSQIQRALFKEFDLDPANLSLASKENRQTRRCSIKISDYFFSLLLSSNWHDKNSSIIQVKVINSSDLKLVGKSEIHSVRLDFLLRIAAYIITIIESEKEYSDTQSYSLPIINTKSQEILNINIKCVEREDATKEYLITINTQMRRMTCIYGNVFEGDLLDFVSCLKEFFEALPKKGTRI
ncbi:hypothetical protein U2F10_11300 [Leptothoe sp. EHU-05/26/07-4]